MTGIEPSTRRSAPVPLAGVAANTINATDHDAFDTASGSHAGNNRASPPAKRRRVASQDITTFSEDKLRKYVSASGAGWWHEAARESAHILPRTPPAREVVLDTETTGSDNDFGRILEIGALELHNGEPSGKTFHTLIKPDTVTSWPMTQEIHGITPDMVANAPSFRQAVRGLLNFIGDSPLVGQNLNYDIRMLNLELKRTDLPQLNQPRTDTLALSRAIFKAARSPVHSLDAQCIRFRIPNWQSKRHEHNALVDAELTARVYKRLRDVLALRCTPEPLNNTEVSQLLTAHQANEAKQKKPKLITEKQARMLDNLRRATGAAGQTLPPLRTLTRQQAINEISRRMIIQNARGFQRPEFAPMSADMAAVVQEWCQILGMPFNPEWRVGEAQAALGLQRASITQESAESAPKSMSADQFQTLSALWKHFGIEPDFELSERQANADIGMYMRRLELQGTDPSSLPGMPARQTQTAPQDI